MTKNNLVIDLKKLEIEDETTNLNWIVLGEK